MTIYRGCLGNSVNKRVPDFVTGGKPWLEVANGRRNTILFSTDTGELGLQIKRNRRDARRSTSCAHQLLLILSKLETSHMVQIHVGRNGWNVGDIHGLRRDLTTWNLRCSSNLYDLQVLFRHIIFCTFLRSVVRLSDDPSLTTL
jgi:hypothetical protein